MANLLFGIVLLLTVLYVGLILYLTLGWSRIRPFKKSNKVLSTTVSIVIAARNEEDKIDQTILDILAQDYSPELFELIIVDDNSTDETAAIVKKYSSRGVKLIQMGPQQHLNSYKKKAISDAINLSTAELIVTTDADCRMNRFWLSTVVEFYEAGDLKLISSPVAFFEEKNPFEEIQTLEFLFLIGLGAAAIGNRVTATCNGANLAYTREVFLELGGFEGIDQLASGDDELLLHKIAEKYPDQIGFCKSKDALVQTHAKATLKEFIQQRKRWASKTTRYKNKGLLFLGISVWMFNLILLISLIASLWNPQASALLMGVLIPKILVEFILMRNLTKFLGRSSLLWYLPLLSVIHIIYLVYIGISGNSGKYEWKGRSVN